MLGAKELPAQQGSWVVQDISDGDRMILGLKSVGEGGSASITARPARLAGIQCPLPGQPYAAYSKAFTQASLQGKFKDAQVKALVNTSPRWVVDFVLPDGTSVCQELLRNGLAWAQPSNISLPEEREYSKGFKALEDQARKGRAGIWSEPNPVPPWKFVAQLPPEQAGPTSDEIKAGKVNTSGMRPRLSPTGEGGASADVTTRVLALMQRKAQVLDKLVQQRNNAGTPGNYETQVRQLDRWANSELERILKEESPREASVITTNLTHITPPAVAELPPTGITALNEDPFVKEKVDELMKQEADMIKQIVDDFSKNNNLDGFDAGMRRVDLWEGEQVAEIVKEGFMHKQEIVMHELDRIPWHETRDWPSWDYTPFRRDVSDHGRWIGRIVGDRNGNIVWYDRPGGPPHWIKYLWLKSIGN
jgi:endonuclease YncB( thermonuclease family)